MDDLIFPTVQSFSVDNDDDDDDNNNNNNNRFLTVVTDGKNSNMALKTLAAEFQLSPNGGASFYFSGCRFSRSASTPFHHFTNKRRIGPLAIPVVINT